MSSISNSLTSSILIGSSILLILVGFAIDLTISKALNDEFDQALRQKAGLLMSLVKNSGGNLDFDFADELMPQYERKTEPEYFQLFLMDGTIIEKSHSLNNMNLPFKNLSGDSGLFDDYTLANGRQIKIFSTTFRPRVDDSMENSLESNQNNAHNNKLLTVLLTIGNGTENLSGFIYYIHATLLTAAVIFIISVLIIIRISVKHSLSPLNELATQIETLEINSLDTKIVISKDVLEIMPIISQLKIMRHRMAHSFEREKQFSDDVSHELRTPVAEIRAIAEVGKQYLDDKKVLIQYFDDLVDISEQMGNIVSTLLALARCEEKVEHSENTILDLDLMLQKIIKHNTDNYSLVAKEIICLCGHSRVSVLSDPIKLQAILSNIIDNALSYNESSIPIEINVIQKYGEVIISVSNHTKSLDANDLEFMFERFWRKDSARSDMYHSGLGLSLVKSFCELLSINVSSELSSKGIFTIRLSNIELV